MPDKTAPPTDITDFTPVQQILIFQFSHVDSKHVLGPNGDEVRYDWHSVSDTIDMIAEGLITFAQVGTPNEHMHLGAADTDPERFCTTCRVIA